jgi:type II secretory pathway pseudopilin PulG
MSRSFSIAKARRGTSLVEVLVVLAVLVIGILAIARLFPAGFYSIRGGQNSDLANRLATGLLDELTKNNASLPDGIYMYSEYSPGKNGFDPQFLPTNLNPFSDSAGVAFNDMDKERWISNETITVPSNRYAANSTNNSNDPADFVPLYTVDFGPIYLPAAPPVEAAFPTTPISHVPYLEVDSMPWAAVSADSSQDPSTGLQSNPADYISPGQSAFVQDLNGAEIAIAPEPYVQVFSISVTDTQGNVVNDTLTIPAAGTTAGSYNGGWFSPSKTYCGNTALWTGLAATWETITLFRPFRCVGFSTTPIWTPKQQGQTPPPNDPYEYALYSNNIGAAFNLGVIAFNPLASGQNGAQPLKARISYEVYDWHILHEDHDIVGGTSGATAPVVDLTLDHLKRNGDTQFDQSVYSGFVPSPVSPVDQADVLWLDLDTGEFTAKLYDTQNASNNYPNTTTAPYVDYDGGAVYLLQPTNSVTSQVESDQRLRFYYMATGDWGLSVQKAPSMYTLASSVAALGAPGSTTPNVYAYNTTSTAGANAQILFPACDAGKTVEFDFLSYINNQTPAQTITVPVATATISAQTELVQGYNVAFVNLGSSGLYASGIAPDIGTSAIGPPSVTKLNGGLIVRGVSARAMVIWRERQNWKIRTVDTVLTNPQ